MPDFNPFDMDLDGDVDGIDFLGFDFLIRHVVRRGEDKRHDGERNAFRNFSDSCDDDETEL